METSTWIALGALLVSLVGLFLNTRKDTKKDAAENAIIQTKLDSVIIGMNDIRVEMRTMRDAVGDHGERLARVEARASNNEHRLEVLERKIKIEG